MSRDGRATVGAVLLLVLGALAACGGQSARADAATADGASGGSGSGGVGSGGSGGAGGGGGSGGSGGAGGGGAGAGGSSGGGGGGGGGDGACAIHKSPPQLLMLFDGSSTMSQTIENTRCAGGDPLCITKWMMGPPAARQVLTETDQQIAWGLKLFPSGTACVLSTTIEIPVMLGSAANIGLLLQSRIPAGSSPIRMALQVATQYLTALPGKGPRAIVLLTDGGANCAPGAASTNDPDDGPTVAAAGAAFLAGFPVFVVGLVPAASSLENNLIQVAAAGNGTPPASTPDYHRAVSADDVATALRAVAASAVSCMFTVTVPGGKDLGAIVLHGAGGAAISRDLSHVDGWDLVGGGPVIRLFGAACTAAAAPTISCP